MKAPDSVEQQLQALTRENVALKQNLAAASLITEQTQTELVKTQQLLLRTVNSVDFQKKPPVLKQDFARSLEMQQTQVIRELATMSPKDRAAHLHRILIALIRNNASAFQKMAYYELYKQAMDMLNEEPPDAPKTPPPDAEQPEVAPLQKTFAEMKKIITTPPPETPRSKEMVNKALVKIMGPQWRTVPSNNTGWRIAYDSQSQKDYWWHATTKATQWTTPEAITNLVRFKTRPLPFKKRFRNSQFKR